MDDQERVAPVWLGHPVVTLPEQIDLTNAQQVSTDLAAALGSGAGIVIADLTGTTFCDSSGVRVLALAARSAAAGGTSLRLVVTAPAVLRIFALSGLDSVLRVYPSLGEALGTGP